MREVVFPIVLRDTNQGKQILAFEHPLAGLQLVKGGIEPGETPLAAARRELFEESGLTASNTTLLKRRPADKNGPAWHMVLCVAKAPPETWTHFCLDDGGHHFTFFWHPLGQKPNAQWHSIFHLALKEIQDLF